MNQLTIDDFMPTPTEDEESIEERIIKLFQQLPSDRQAVVLDELHELAQDDDGIEVEIIDDDEMPY